MGGAGVLSDGTQGAGRGAVGVVGVRAGRAVGAGGEARGRSRLALGARGARGRADFFWARLAGLAVAAVRFDLVASRGGVAAGAAVGARALVKLGG